MAQTTTTEDIETTGAEALPADDAQAAAVTETTEPKPSEQKAEPAEEPKKTEEPAPQDKGGERPLPDDYEEKLKSFAKGQGIESVDELTDREKSLLKAAYDNKASADRSLQRSNELEKAANITQEQLPADATPQDQENARLRNLELRMEIQQWKFQNQDKLGLERDMAKLLADPDRKAMVQGGYMSLDDVYAIAKANAPDNSDAIRAEGKREGLESLAHKQQAAVPTGKATNPAASPKGKDFKDKSISEMEAELGFAQG